MFPRRRKYLYKKHKDFQWENSKMVKNVYKWGIIENLWKKT